MMKRCYVAAGAVILGLVGALGVPSPASATYVVQVGYADDLRLGPLFPTPFCAGEGNVQAFVGDSSHCGTGPTQLDSGAIRIINTGASAISVDGLHVNVPTWFGNGAGGVDLWTGALPIVLAPGNSAVFVQTAGENFDTSDFGLGIPPDPFNNCSQGVKPAVCAGNEPIVTPTVDGVATSFTDTAFILNTGGFDSVNSNPCIGGNNEAVGNVPGACNESLPWRDIGGSGLLPTPEPASLALLGSALAGFGWFRRRKRGSA
jgi:hypothetical protein